MKITIRLIYMGWENKILIAGSFPANEHKFKEDPDKEAARVANKWIKEIKREEEINEILKVVYDGDKEITELIKEPQ